MHPLHAALIAAAHGSYPPVDGVAEVHRPGSDRTHGVIEFTGHTYVLTDHAPDDVLARGADGFGGATHPDIIRWLAGPDGVIGSHDAVLVSPGRGAALSAEGGAGADHGRGEHGGARRAGDGRPAGDGRRAGGGLLVRTDLDDHPRVVRARHHRTNVRVHGDDRGLVTLGTGVVGRTEIAVELLDASHGSGAGRALIAAGLELADRTELVWAQVAPGNAASLRAFLSCGFVPIGAERLVDR